MLAASVSAREIRKRDPIEGHRAVARVYTRQKKQDLVQSCATPLRLAPGAKDVTEALKRVS